MSDYGEFLGEGSVRLRRRVPGPIERVWQYQKYEREYETRIP
jgi:hypothetical protein